MERLNVYLNGEQIGELRFFKSGKYEFQYANEWIHFPNAIPLSVSLPLSSQIYKTNAVINYFDNLLPENSDIRYRIQDIFRAKSAGIFDLLTVTGADCIGAVQILPVSIQSSVQKITADKLSHTKIAKLLRNIRINKHPLGMNTDHDFRISLAGVQAKTALLKIKNNWYLPKNNTPSSHILKLQITDSFDKLAEGPDLRNSVENEYLCNVIIKEFGLPIANCKIETFAEISVLAVERFDRIWKDNKKWLFRIPQEDFCQVFELAPTKKYQSDGGPGIIKIMEFLKGSYNQNDRFTFLKAQFLFWTMAAIDGHAKNFSIHHLPGGRFQLTPLYDIISAWPTLHANFPEQKLKMAMAVKGKNQHYKWNSIFLHHWIRTAKDCSFEPVQLGEFITYYCDTLENKIEKIQNKITNDTVRRIAKKIFSGMRKSRENCSS